MIEFDTEMIWRRRTSSPGAPSVYSDTEIAGKIIGERRKRADSRTARRNDEIAALFAPPAEPRPGDLVRLNDREYRVVESAPCRDLDGELRGCSCTLLRTETEFDRVVLWRSRSSAVGELPVYRDSTVNCRLVGRILRRAPGDYADDFDEPELLFPPAVEPRPGDLVRWEEREYRVTRSEPCFDPDGNPDGWRCALSR